MASLPEFDAILREAIPIGAIRVGDNYQKEIFLPCQKCKKERWVRLKQGKPRAILCNACARDKKVEQRCLICGQSFTAHRYLAEDGYGNYCSPECRNIAQSQRISGEGHPMWKGGKTTYLCEQCGLPYESRPSVNRKYCSHSCNLISQRKQGLFCKNPNKAESAIISILEEHNFPYKYVGDGEVWFGNRNPDFINTDGKKQVIELFGTYWHPVFDMAQRIEHYKQYGFDCLIIWEDELANSSNLIKRIKRYAKC